jgi:hypothetical protein
MSWSDHRRAFFRILAVSLMGLKRARPLLAVESADRGSSSEADEIAQIRQKLSDAGLGGSAEARSEHFLVLGNAPQAFQRQALARCEELGEAFLSHFRDRGFEVKFPNGRLTLITLKDLESYGALQGEAPGKDVGGHYDLETNRLVVYDFRSRRDELAAQAERINLFTLVHESAHQLSFNTGILERGNEPPLCVSEGLATYVELWSPGTKNSIGGKNTLRLKALRQAGDWIPIADLLAGDAAFQPETEQLAYAESWVLMHYLLRTSARRPKLRDYLGQLRGAKKPGDRARVAEKALGPLARLNRDLKEEAQKYLRG